MRVQPAETRTFYLERYGTEWRVVKVWDRGAAFTPEDMQGIVQRVLETEPDERVMAMQEVSIRPGPRGVAIEGRTAQRTNETLDAAARLFRGEKPEPERQQ